ncbi:MAG: DUF1439 domain-containing protein [Gammaproteobacteria bacterium]|nr:DUF1439 domain-containing protein [Gammaproteobacteria bacterium]MCF6231323.1 DUF1439 domain-containing protein [Gammaproteobacteria bacterium]
MFKTITFILTLLFTTPLLAGFEIEITPQQIQQVAEKQFPIKKQALFVQIELSNPKVTLTGQRLSLAMQVVAAYPNQTISQGTVVVDGRLGYNEKSGEFLLIQPRVQTITVEGLASQHSKWLKDIISPLVAQSVTTVVLYRLDENQFRDRMTKSSLKSITVREGTLYAEIAW